MQSVAYQRKSIFDKWAITPLPTLPNSKPPPDTQLSILKAKQCIEEAIFILHNINGFWRVCTQYSTEFSSDNARIQAQLAHLSGLPPQSSEEQLETEYSTHLPILEQCLSHAISTSCQIQDSFRGVCLSNYDRGNVEINFSNNRQSNREQLQGKVNQIRFFLKAMEEELALRENKMEIKAVLREYHDFQYQYEALGTLIEKEKLAQIHVLMLYELQCLDQDIKLQKERIRNYSEQYAVHEAIYDAITIMREQTQEMQQGVKAMRGRMDVIEETESQCSANIEVYRANAHLIGRYAVEHHFQRYKINQYKYGRALEEYQEELRRYKGRNNEVKGVIESKKIMERIVHQREILFQDKVSIGKIYHYCKKHDQSVAEMIERESLRRGVKVPRYIYSEVEYYKEESRIFYQLQCTPIPMKEEYILSKCKSIANIPSRHTMHPYKNGISFLSILISDTTEQAKLVEMNKVGGLPKQLLSHAYNCIRDKTKYISGVSKVESQVTALLKQFEAGVKKRLSSVWVAGEFNRSIQLQIQAQVESICSSLIARLYTMSEHSWRLKQLTDDYLIESLTQTIEKIYSSYPKNVHLLTHSLNYKEFMTVDTLCGILREKLLCSEDTVRKILSCYCERLQEQYCFAEPCVKVLEIIKLTLLMRVAFGTTAFGSVQRVLRRCKVYLWAEEVGEDRVELLLLLQAEMYNKNSNNGNSNGNSNNIHNGNNNNNINNTNTINNISQIQCFLQKVRFKPLITVSEKGLRKLSEYISLRKQVEELQYVSEVNASMKALADIYVFMEKVQRISQFKNIDRYETIIHKINKQVKISIEDVFEQNTQIMRRIKGHLTIIRQEYESEAMDRSKIIQLTKDMLQTLNQ